MRPARHLLEVCEHLNGVAPLAAQDGADRGAHRHETGPDLRDVRGQEHAKRALEVAAAGAHSLLFLGPPGTGKSMLASRLPGILPELSEAEALETAAVRSVERCGRLRPGALAGAPLPLPPSHRLRGGPGGGRQQSAARRDLAGPPGGAVPG